MPQRHSTAAPSWPKHPRGPIKSPNFAFTNLFASKKCAPSRYFLQEGCWGEWDWDPETTCGSRIRVPLTGEIVGRGGAKGNTLAPGS